MTIDKEGITAERERIGLTSDGKDFTRTVAGALDARGPHPREATRGLMSHEIVRSESRKLGIVAGASVTPEESRAQSAAVAARWARQRPAIVVLTLGGTLLFIGPYREK